MVYNKKIILFLGLLLICVSSLNFVFALDPEKLKNSERELLELAGVDDLDDLEIRPTSTGTDLMLNGERKYSFTGDDLIIYKDLAGGNVGLFYSKKNPQVRSIYIEEGGETIKLNYNKIEDYISDDKVKNFYTKDKIDNIITGLDKDTNLDQDIVEQYIDQLEELKKIQEGDVSTIAKYNLDHTKLTGEYSKASAPAKDLADLRDTSSGARMRIDEFQKYQGTSNVIISGKSYANLYDRYEDKLKEIDKICDDDKKKSECDELRKVDEAISNMPDNVGLDFISGLTDEQLNEVLESRNRGRNGDDGYIDKLFQLFDIETKKQFVSSLTLSSIISSRDEIYDTENLRDDVFKAINDAQSSNPSLDPVDYNSFSCNGLDNCIYEMKNFCSGSNYKNTKTCLDFNSKVSSGQFIEDRNKVAIESVKNNVNDLIKGSISCSTVDECDSELDKYCDANSNDENCYAAKVAMDQLKNREVVKTNTVYDVYQVLDLFFNPDPAAMAGAKLFGFEPDYSSVPAFLRDDISSSICAVKIDGYLDKTSSNNGGVTKYTVTNTSKDILITGDIRAQGTRVTPDGKKQITYSYLARALEDETLNIKVTINYQADGRSQSQTIVETTVSKGGVSSGFENIILDLNTTDVNENSFNIVLESDSDLYLTTPVVLITAGE